MRVSSALAFPLFLAASAVADSCTCDSSSASNNEDWYDSPLYHPKPIKNAPKLPPTPENIQQGIDNAVQGLTDKNILPPEIAQPIQQAVASAIAKQQANPSKVVVVASSEGTKTTLTVTPSPTVVESYQLVGNTTVTNYVTRTITAMPPGATILSNQTLAALDEIQDAINDAIAAVNLSTTGLDAATQAELSSCLSQVLQNGGLPSGYSCISQTGSTSAGLKSTFNNILEQFLGILPAKVIDGLQDAVMPMLSGLLPNESTLLNNINSAIASVVSSLSGNSVTAIEMMQSCYTMAIRQNGNTSYLQCYMSDGGPFETLQTGMNSVIQQFVGYLPPTLLDSVQNLTASTLQAGAYEDLAGIGTNLTQQLNAALKSVMSTLSGNSVTLMLQLQECANELIVNGNATAAQNCITQGPANSARTMVNGIAEQYSGYLPSAFFSDLVSIVGNMSDTGAYSESQIVSALDQAFNQIGSNGPAYVGCFEQVQACLLDEIRASGNYSSTCPGPVKGCELLTSQNSTSLASTTSSESVSSTVELDSGIQLSTSSASSSETVAPALSSPSATSTSAAATTTSDSQAAETSSSSSTVEPSETPSSSSSAEESATTSSTSSVAATSTSSSTEASSGTPSASSSPASETSTPTQRFVKRNNGTLKRSHAKLRVLYDGHYHKL